MKVVLILLLFGLLHLDLAKADGQDVFDQNEIQDVSEVKVSPVIGHSQVLKREIRSSLNRKKNGKTRGNRRRKIKSNKLNRKALKNKRTRKVRKMKGKKLKRKDLKNKRTRIVSQTKGNRVGKVSNTKGSKLKRKIVKHKRKINRNKNNSPNKPEPKLAKPKKMANKIRQVRQNNCDLDMCKRSSNFYRQIVRLNDRSKIINSRAKKSDAYKLVAKILTSKCEATTNSSKLNTSLLGCAASITSICVAPKIPDDLTNKGKCLPEIEKFRTACGDSTTSCSLNLTDWTDFVTSNKGCRPTEDEKTMSITLRTCSKGVKPCKLVETDALNYIANCELPISGGVTCSTASTDPSSGASTNPNSTDTNSSSTTSDIVTGVTTTTKDSSATTVSGTVDTTTPKKCAKHTDCNCNTECEIPPWNTTDPVCEYCHNGTCTKGCTKDKDMCPTNYKCNENHECLPKCACTSNSDCPNFKAPCGLRVLQQFYLPATVPDTCEATCEYCNNCTCKRGCSPINTQANCPEGFTCNGVHECVPIEPDCTTVVFTTPNFTTSANTTTNANTTTTAFNTTTTVNTTTAVNTTTTTLATTTTTIPPTTTPPCNSSNDCGVHPCSCEGQCSEAEGDPCYYCNNGKCDPGCASDLDCKNGHMCLYQVCIPETGKVAMKSLKMTSNNCTGCNTTDKTGAKIVIKGDPSRYQCTINNLDVTKETKTVTSEQELGPTQNGGCYKGDLDGFKITDFTVTWNGQGAWTPGNFTITYYLYNTRVECNNVNGVTLPNGTISDATFECGDPYDIPTI